MPTSRSCKINKAESGAAFAEVKQAVATNGGWLRFDSYLQIVQHGANGYYGAGRVKFGGDFVTAPGVSPLFAGALAAQVAEIVGACGGGVLELGAGDGTLARGILSAPGCEHCAYEIVEPSPALRKLQQKNLAGLPVSWREQLPPQFNGAVVANEVLDCLPFRLLHKCNGEWLERGVVLQDDGLAFSDRPMDAELKLQTQSLPSELPEGYQTEICPQAAALANRTAAMLQNGAALFLDYGFGAREYYHPQRSGGTMMCHRDNQADDNPLQTPGEKDITAHVDFTLVADAAENAGAELLGYANQASFLINCGITDLLAENRDSGDLHYAKLSAGVNKLLSPSEMGELFKALAFGKNAPPLSGFRANTARL